MGQKFRLKKFVTSNTSKLVSQFHAKFQTNEFESFAPIQVSKNGHSSMIFGVDAYKMAFKNGALSSKKELGTWSIENPREFNLKPGMTLGGIAAETIYKVVTVIVSL